ncbi:MAG: phosphate ABC transporter substrate-binding protein PstS [Sphingomonadales bacterium]|nr:phosphate ABC transporter substrate-binding protein PstS [Sphingomonadales bacterium]MDE2170006.1 phosphate ABC transporter substrate-binding protein PstS [Sphingomonadales bacterium]
MSKFSKSLTVVATVAALATGGAALADITGAGSTFVYPILSKWSADYSSHGGERINYQSIGSGGGIAQIKAGTVTFGATDKPLDANELNAAGLAQFPVVIGGVVPVVHLSGVRPGQLRLSGEVLAEIYAGQIKGWNDGKIARLNPGLRLPNAAITVVHRSDGSGTTFNFTHYLSQVSPLWRGKDGTSVSWPAGIGGKGNEGVAAYVNQVNNSIGYVEYAYVVQNHMNYTQVQNAAGKFVSPSTQTFQAAASHADWAHARDFYLVMTNAPGANSYPITATTFALMYKHPKNPAQSASAIKFFKWALEHGQGQAVSLQYVPLPAPLVKQIESYISANIK